MAEINWAPVCVRLTAVLGPLWLIYRCYRNLDHEEPPLLYEAAGWSCGLVQRRVHSSGSDICTRRKMSAAVGMGSAGRGRGSSAGYGSAHHTSLSNWLIINVQLVHNRFGYHEDDE